MTAASSPRRRPAAALAPLLVALAGVGGAPGARAQDGVDARTAAVAEAYGVARWPAPGPRRAKAPLLALAVPGLAHGRLAVDPERGEATLELVQAAGAGDATVAVVTLRRLETAAAARKALLARLASVQVRLAPLEGAGEVAFATPPALGPASLALAVRGNVLAEVRRADGAGPGAPGVAQVALAVDALLRAAPVAAPEGPLPAPRLLALRADGARAGAPTRLVLDVDPAGPPVAWARFTCTGDAAVVEGPDGWTLLAPASGVVLVRVAALGAGLEAASFETKVVVGE